MCPVSGQILTANFSGLWILSVNVRCCIQTCILFIHVAILTPHEEDRPKHGQQITLRYQDYFFDDTCATYTCMELKYASKTNRVVFGSHLKQILNSLACFHYHHYIKVILPHNAILLSDLISRLPNYMVVCYTTGKQSSIKRCMLSV